MMSSTPVSGMFSQVQDTLQFYCSTSIVQSFLNSDQNKKMRELWDSFASKHSQINGGGPSLGGSNAPDSCSMHFDYLAIYKDVFFSADGVSCEGDYYEKLRCELVEKKSWGSHNILSTCDWEAEICYSEKPKDNLICVKNTVKFDLDDSKTQGIPQEAPEVIAKELVQDPRSALSSQATSNKIPNTPPSSPTTTTPVRTLAVGAGAASTAYFAYKAYKEIRSIYEGKEQAKETPNKSKEKASGWRAVGYAAAAIGSGAFTVYAIKI